MQPPFTTPSGRAKGLLLPLLAVPLVVIVTASCASSGSGDSEAAGSGGSAWDGKAISEPVALDAGYAVEVAFKSDVRVNGVATGELDPKWPGQEIVAVDHLGRVVIIARDGDSFRHQTIASTGGELVQVAVGDLLLSPAGSPAMDEIVAVGANTGTEDDLGPGIVRVFHREASGRWAEISYLTPALVHGVAVGSMGLADNDQFLCAGFFPEALIGTLTTKVEGGSVAMGIGAVDLPPIGNVKDVAFTDEGFVLAADDGHSVEYMVLPGEISHQAPIQHGSPLARVTYSKDDGVLLADDDGFLRIISKGPAPTSSILVRAKQRLRGAVFLDIDPNHAGLEACTAGYDSVIRVVELNRVEQKELDVRGQPTEIGWEGEVRNVARDSGKIHHLTSGNIAGIGTCLISCGYSGNVLLIHRQDR